MNDQEATGCCCPPMTQDSEELKKIKPIQTIGVFIYIGMLILDICYLKNYDLVTYIILILTLSFFTFNRCFVLFQFFTLICIFLIFQTGIPGMGIQIQTLFQEPNIMEAIILFFIYLFIVVASCIIFFFGFNAYKEMNSLYEQRISANPQLIPSYMANYQGDSGNNYNNYGGNNYNNNQNNNQSSSSNKGFKAFSGKGYVVGGN